MSNEGAVATSLLTGKGSSSANGSPAERGRRIETLVKRNGLHRTEARLAHATP